MSGSMDSAELWLLGARCPCDSNSYAIAVPLGNVDTLHCALLTRNKDADSAVPVGTTLMSSEYPGLHPGLLSVVPTGLACDRFILLLVGKCRCETLRKGAHAALSRSVALMKVLRLSIRRAAYVAVFSSVK